MPLTCLRQRAPYGSVSKRMATEFTALIPVNRLDRAKGRLSELLGADERARLALATLRTVLEAVRAAGGHAVVLTGDDAVAANLDEGAELLLEDSAVSGLNPQLEYALEAMGHDEVLVLHADLPLASAEALERIVRGAPPPPSATIVRSPDGGTNAMFLRPPGSFPLRYGRDSAALHRQAAFAAGVTFSRRTEPALALDLDTPEDVAALFKSEQGRDSRAGRLLAELGVRARLHQSAGR